MSAVMPRFVRWRTVNGESSIAEFSYQGRTLDVSIADLIKERQGIHSVEWREQIGRALDAWSTLAAEPRDAGGAVARAASR